MRRAFWILDFGFWILALAAIHDPKWTTNSRAENQRGTKLYVKGDYAAAVKSFAAAASASPSPASDFNLGTAQIASGAREEGSANVARALRDPKLRASALFNRGNAALASSAYDYAIRDYRDVLRIDPNNKAAKRNLEIALIRKQEKEQQSSSGSRGKNQQPSAQPNQRPQQPSPANGSPSPQAGQADPEALLRSVQQQEQEELERMRQQRARSGHVGW